jgi:hypothetical protein
MPSYHCPLVIAIKSNAKEKFRTAAMLLFYILQKSSRNRFAYFSKTYCKTFRNLKLSVASVIPALGFGVHVFINDCMKL